MARRYRQTRRAEASAATRQRIVDATIELHMTLGPAETTISAVAARAGVERLTVYRHFPEQEQLFRECVEHGWARFPPPDHRAWARTDEPEERLRLALTELYEYYAVVGDALSVIVGDFPRVPLLAALNAPYLARWQEMGDVLARGWNRRGGRRRALRAAIAHTLELSTWQSLVRRQGLAQADAVDLLVRMVSCA